MGYHLTRREFLGLRRTNSEYAVMKQYKSNKDEYELKTHLYERQRSHSSDCNIIQLKDIPRCLEQECNIPHDIEP